MDNIERPEKSVGKTGKNRTIVATSVVLSVMSVMMAKAIREGGPAAETKIGYVRRKQGSKRSPKKIVSNPRAHYSKAGKVEAGKAEVGKIVVPRVNPKPQKLSFLQRLVQLKRIGVNSVKDFLELGELNLRLGLNEDERGDGIAVVWDSDGSSEYILIISPSYIPKTVPLQHNSILTISEEDLEHETLGKSFSKRWKRKVRVVGHGAEIVCLYNIPFRNFHCRLISSNGRISRNLEHHNIAKKRNSVCSGAGGSGNSSYEEIYRRPEIDAWISSEGDGRQKTYYLHVKEDNGVNTTSVSKIHEYVVVLYVGDGQGLRKKVPRFIRYVKFKLGLLPPCLCYIAGVRTIGTSIEQFVAWIGEE